MSHDNEETNQLGFSSKKWGPCYLPVEAVSQ